MSFINRDGAKQNEIDNSKLLIEKVYSNLVQFQVLYGDQHQLLFDLKKTKYYKSLENIKSEYLFFLWFCVLSYIHTDITDQTSS